MDKGKGRGKAWLDDQPSYRTEALRDMQKRPRIQPTDKAFQAKFDFFRKEIDSRKPIDLILRENFTKSEAACLFPDYVEPDEFMQGRLEALGNAYYDLIQYSIFASCESSIQMKMTMLYFGFPVAAEIEGWDIGLGRVLGREVLFYAEPKPASSKDQNHSREMGLSRSELTNSST